MLLDKKKKKKKKKKNLIKKEFKNHIVRFVYLSCVSYETTPWVHERSVFFFVPYGQPTLQILTKPGIPKAKYERYSYNKV